MRTACFRRLGAGRPVDREPPNDIAHVGDVLRVNDIDVMLLCIDRPYTL